MAPHITARNILSALSSTSLTNIINSVLSAAQSRINFDMMMQPTWSLYVNYTVTNVVLCIAYAGLRAGNEDAPGGCACAIMSFPLSVIPMFT
jgi:hypothetical protein